MRIHRMLFAGIIAAWALFPACLYSQPVSGNPQQELLDIQKEIKEIEARLAKRRASEEETQQDVEKLEEELALRNRLLHKLNQKEWSLERSIRSTRSDIEGNSSELEKLRKSYAQRVLHLYKYGRTNELEALFTSKSFSQAMLRLRYVRIIMEEERKGIHKIKNLIAELNGKRARLDNNLSEQRRLIQDKNEEKETIDSRRKERVEVLKEIRKDTKFLSRRLEEMKDSEKKQLAIIQQLIARREREVEPVTPSAPRIPRDKYVPGAAFATQRGRLPWPVRGEVTARFGLNHNPSLNTRTDNPGIDIKASYGADVHCVSDGRVAYIIYLPGYGNMVFVEHPGGFFSVYGNLSEINVAVGTVVGAGRVIAKVGDSGSYEGAKLNFQIWKEDSKLNPEQWLGS